MYYNLLYSTLLPVFASGVIIGISIAYIIFKRSRTESEEISTENAENFEFSDSGKNFRLVMCIRNDLKMGKGKVAAQCGHAAVAAYVKGMKQAPNMVRNWLRFGQTKITLKIDSEAELLELQKAAKKLSMLTNIIRDAGRTQIEPGSKTVLSIGPGPSSIIDQVTGHLKLY